MINLLGNAIKFTERGYVKLTVTYQRRTTVKNQGTFADTLIFAVEDTGVGINPEEIDSLFHLFLQAEAGRKLGQGTGLGLAISKKLVDKETTSILNPTVIIALTACVFEENQTTILAAGCNDFVSKPCQLSVILAKMSQHLIANALLNLINNFDCDRVMALTENRDYDFND